MVDALQRVADPLGEFPRREQALRLDHAALGMPVLAVYSIRSDSMAASYERAGIEARTD